MEHPFSSQASFDGGELDCGNGLLLLIRKHIDPLAPGELLEIRSSWLVEFLVSLSLSCSSIVSVWLKTELDVGDFGRNGVYGGVAPVLQIGRRFRCVDFLGSWPTGRLAFAWQKLPNCEQFSDRRSMAANSEAIRPGIPI